MITVFDKEYHNADDLRKILARDNEVLYFDTDIETYFMTVDGVLSETTTAEAISWIQKCFPYDDEDVATERLWHLGWRSGKGLAYVERLYWIDLTVCTGDSRFDNRTYDENLDKIRGLVDSGGLSSSASVHDDGAGSGFVTTDDPRDVDTIRLYAKNIG